MKKNQILTIAAAALAMGFASCNKEEASTPSKESFQVTLNFKNAGSRAVGGAAHKGDKVSIVNGYICFVSSGNAITDVYTIGTTPTSGKNILNTDLGSTAVKLSGVPGASTKVYMLINKGSLSSTLAPVVGQSISSFMDNYMKLEDQGDYTKVTSSGSANLTAGATANEKNASISLSTEVSRIQISDITFDSKITGGKIEGIFVNGYYPTMQFDGDAGSLTGSIVAVDYADNTTIFPSVVKTYAYDILNENIAATVKPSGQNVWGYNLFASATPQIIIKLSGVVVDGQTLTTTQFVTVNGFNNTATATPIDKIAGGMIYTIPAGALVIKPEHLTEQPGVTPINVNVTVTTVVWDETQVTPNL